MHKKKTRNNARASSPAQYAKSIAYIIKRADPAAIDKVLIGQILGLDLDKGLDPNQLVSAADTARQLGCSEKTLANRRVSGSQGLPFVKNGSRVLYQQSHITAFIERNVRISTSDKGGAK